MLAKPLAPVNERTPQVTRNEILSFIQKYIPEWKYRDGKISREYTFRNFVEAMGFVNVVAGIAERFQHHPDIHIHYNRVLIELWTHAVNGITENDLLLALHIESVVQT